MRRSRSKRPAIIVGSEVHIPLTRGKTAVVDLADRELANVSWYAMKGRNTWYAVREAARTPVLVVELLHREVARRAGMEVDGKDTDHRDGDGLNCRRLNLRAAERVENCHNTPVHRDNKSGVKGVSWDASRELWNARIMARGKNHHLGRFKELSDAEAAYKAAASELHGEFARLG